MVVRLALLLAILLPSPLTAQCQHHRRKDALTDDVRHFLVLRAAAPFATRWSAVTPMLGLRRDGESLSRAFCSTWSSIPTSIGMLRFAGASTPTPVQDDYESIMASHTGAILGISQEYLHGLVNAKLVRIDVPQFPARNRLVARYRTSGLRPLLERLSCIGEPHEPRPYRSRASRRPHTISEDEVLVHTQQAWHRWQEFRTTLADELECTADTDFAYSWVSVPVVPAVATALRPCVVSASAASARGRKTATAGAA